MQVEDEEQICEIVNDYFSSVFTSERLEGLTVLENKLKRNKVSSNSNSMLITEELVYLSSLKSNKVHEDDDMGSLMLKKLANELKGVLSIH